MATCDTALYDRVQNAVNCTVVSEGAAAGSLAQAVIAGQEMATLPQSCMGPYLDLIDCDRPLCEKQRRKALEAFENVTGFQPFDMNLLIDAYTVQQIKMLNFIAYYIFIPLIIITLLVCWVLVGFGMISWEAGFWYSVFVITLLMMFKVGFSIHGQSFIRQQARIGAAEAVRNQEDFENAIAYLPAANYAIACAVAGDHWECNCGPCRMPPHDDDHDHNGGKPPKPGKPPHGKPGHGKPKPGKPKSRDPRGKKSPTADDESAA